MLDVEALRPLEHCQSCRSMVTCVPRLASLPINALCRSQSTLRRVTIVHCAGPVLLCRLLTTHCGQAVRLIYEPL
jgi:hypothetical protein